MNIDTIFSSASRNAVVKHLRHPTLGANWSVLTFSGLASQVLNMLSIFRIARVLQPQGFGEYNLVITTASVAFIFGALGLRQVIIRECARDAAHGTQIFRMAVFLRAGAAIVVGIGTLVYAKLIPDALEAGLELSVLLLLGAQLLWDTVESVLFGLQQMVIPSLINILGSLMWVTLIWAVPTVYFTSITVSISFALLQIAKAVVLSSVWLRKDNHHLETDVLPTKHTGSLLSTGLPFYWLAIMTAMSSSIPVLLMGIRSNQIEIGLFNAPWRILAPLLLLLNTGMTALYPVLSKQSANDKAGFDLSVKWAAIIIIILGSCLALCASLVRRELVSLLFGMAFIRSADVLMYQCWGTLLGGIYYLIGVVLSARDRQRSLAVLSTIYAGVTVPLVWYGSMYGAAGLALGLLASGLINLPYHWIVFQRTMPTRVPSRQAGWLLLFVIALAIPAYIIPPEGHLILRGTTVASALALTTFVLMKGKRMIPSGIPERNVVVSIPD